MDLNLLKLNDPLSNTMKELLLLWDEKEFMGPNWWPSPRTPHGDQSLVRIGRESRKLLAIYPEEEEGVPFSIYQQQFLLAGYIYWLSQRAKHLRSPAEEFAVASYCDKAFFQNVNIQPKEMLIRSLAVMASVETLWQKDESEKRVARRIIEEFAKDTFAPRIFPSVAKLADEKPRLERLLHETVEGLLRKDLESFPNPSINFEAHGEDYSPTWQRGIILWLLKRIELVNASEINDDDDIKNVLREYVAGAYTMGRYCEMAASAYHTRAEELTVGHMPRPLRWKNIGKIANSMAVANQKKGREQAEHKLNRLLRVVVV